MRGVNLHNTGHEPMKITASERLHPSGSRLTQHTTRKHANTWHVMFMFMKEHVWQPPTSCERHILSGAQCVEMCCHVIPCEEKWDIAQRKPFLILTMHFVFCDGWAWYLVLLIGQAISDCMQPRSITNLLIKKNKTDTLSQQTDVWCNNVLQKCASFQ